MRSIVWLRAKATYRVRLDRDYPRLRRFQFHAFFLFFFFFFFFSAVTVDQVFCEQYICVLFTDPINSIFLATFLLKINFTVLFIYLKFILL